MSYEILDHTADAKFRARGATREEAFTSAVQAMTAIVTDPQMMGDGITFHISVTASTSERLLFDMLDEILFLMDTEKFLPCRAEHLTIVERDGKLVLDATLRGDDARKTPGNLKAVTYSDMIVRQEPDGTWIAQAVIDI